MEEIYRQSTFKTYEISNFGNVRNKKTGTIRKIGYSGTTPEYGMIRIMEGGKMKSLRVWQEVAKAFVPNPDNKEMVDHIDRNPRNCHYTNLRWVSRSKNTLNRDVLPNNKLGIKGIRENQGGYQARIVIDKIKHSKWFKTLEEAQQWRNEKENSIHW